MFRYLCTKYNGHSVFTIKIPGIVSFAINFYFKINEVLLGIEFSINRILNNTKSKTMLMDDFSQPFFEMKTGLRPEDGISTIIPFNSVLVKVLGE